MIPDYKMPKAQCPHCEAVHNGALNTTGTKHPLPGDLSVCSMCAGLSQFNEDMQLVLLTEDELAQLPPEYKENISRAQAAVRAYNQRRRKQ